MDKKIYLEFPIKERNDTMKFEIYLNGKYYNQISLDELCYKELKVYFAKSKDDDDNNKNNLKISLNHSLNPNFILETKNYPHRIFRSNEDFNTWIRAKQKNNVY